MENNIYRVIEEEIRNYQQKTVPLSDGVKFSQYELVKNLSRYENHIYENGKYDTQGNYKYWYDIITPRINDEVKNIDFDRSNIITDSDSFNDRLAVRLSYLSLKELLTETGQGEELNDSVEEFTAWGNVLWKKVKGGYEKCDLKNIYILNQTAKSVKDSIVIERHLLTQSDLRAKKDVWKNIDTIIEKCGINEFSPTSESEKTETSNPYYDIYERNGEISEDKLFEAQGKSGGSKKKFVLAKIIGTNPKGDSGNYILFAEKISEMPYRETHRGRYEGRWFRKGMIETLIDCQITANTVGNQIARGCEFASKVLLRTNDDTFVQNILTDIENGDIIKAKDLMQVDLRMTSLDQLMVNWNRNLTVADRLANSYEVVTGQNLPSNTPFKLGNQMNMNANKLFDFLREKLTMSFEKLLNDWLLPSLMIKLNAKKVIDLTNSEENLKDYYQMVVDSWYLINLPKLPPHSPEIAQLIKAKKLEEIITNKKAVIKIEKGFWDNAKLRIKCKITGENVKLKGELEDLATFIQLESDPVRRSAEIEMAMAKKNIDISNLPKSTPEQLMGGQGQMTNSNNEMAKATNVPVK